nr:unnamed protein product [Digitaria exilis]
MIATVDNLKRLCIDHYFEEEIESAMGVCISLVHSDDLHDATLPFRLMRETGHDVSADDVLRRFTDSAGEFSLALSKDIGGLLSLHDMSHLDIGEESLHKAKKFSTKHLASAIRDLEPGLATYYKARHHLSYLQSLPNRNTAAMEEWWMELGLAQEIPVARDQVLKWYTWSMTILQGPSLSRYRVEITKIIAIAYVVDDIFDLVGTLDELSLFTKAIKVWDIAADDSLPSCIRSCYKALYTWEVLFDGFMVEAKWLATNQVPTAEEYLRNGVVTSGVPLAFVNILFLLGHHHAADMDATELTDHIPPAISSAAKILRLWDDMGSAQDEGQEGLDGSYRELYLMENPAGDAEEHMKRLIAREWAELNRECFSRRTFSDSFSQACLNAARMVSVMYSYDKEQRLPVLEDYMRMLLI